MATDLDRILSVSITSSDAPDVPLNFVLRPDAEAIKIGRNPKSEVVVNRGGVSWAHLELLVSTDADDNAILEVKDLSSNGAVLQLPYQHGRRLEKGIATTVPHCAVLLLPYRVKEEAEASGNARTQLLVRIDGEEDPVPPPDGEAPPLPLPEQAPPPPPEDDQPQQPSGTSVDPLEPPPPPELNLATRSRSRSRSRKARLKKAPVDSYDPEATPDTGATMVDAADAAVASVLASRSEVAASENSCSKRGRRVEKENAAGANPRPAKNGETLTPGCKVRVVGFQAKGEWNGKCGTLLQLDAVAGIWKVRMEDGSGKAFRPRNLELVEGPSKPAAAPDQGGDAAAPTAGCWQGADLVAGLPVLSKSAAPKLPPLLTGPLPGPLPTGPPPRGPPPSGPPPAGPPPLGPPPNGPPPLGPPPNGPGLPAPAGFPTGPPPNGPPPSGPPPSGPPPSGPPPSGPPPAGPPPGAVIPAGAAVPVGMPLPLTMPMSMPMAMPLGVPPLGFPMPGMPFGLSLPATQGIPPVRR
mmetsp:Transcript_34005/g.62223  ORF Transcript_34005/g.62223 Transcript_34005/m.62223 type:complete len:523 (+) Transcript_34005:183-1751(+)